VIGIQLTEQKQEWDRREPAKTKEMRLDHPPLPSAEL
jgi:hypothetical protein